MYPRSLFGTACKLKFFSCWKCGLNVHACKLQLSMSGIRLVACEPCDFHTASETRRGMRSGRCDETPRARTCPLPRRDSKSLPHLCARSHCGRWWRQSAKWDQCAVYHSLQFCFVQSRTVLLASQCLRLYRTAILLSWPLWFISTCSTMRKNVPYYLLSLSYSLLPLFHVILLRNSLFIS
jgi:hypothetical protein